MRTAVLLVRKHDSEDFELAYGPQIPLVEQTQELRELLSSNGVHGEFAEAQLWTSDGGLQRTVKFKSEAGAQAEAAQRDEDNAAQAEAQKAAEKPKAKDTAKKGEKKDTAKKGENNTGEGK